MNCSRCGKETEDGLTLCPACAAQEEGTEAAAPTEETASTAAAGYARRTDIVCTAALCISFLSLFLGLLGATGLVGIGFSIWGLWRFEKGGGSGQRRAIIALVLGAISVLYGLIQIQYLLQ